MLLICYHIAAVELGSFVASVATSKKPVVKEMVHVTAGASFVLDDNTKQALVAMNGTEGVL